MFRLGDEVRSQVKEVQNQFRKPLRGIAKVFVGYSLDISNENVVTEDRFRILLYPRNSSGKLVFYASSSYLSSFFDSTVEQFKSYCTALEGVKQTDKEYRRVWADTIGMYQSLDLLKVSFPTNSEDGEFGNNIPIIMSHLCITADEMSRALGKDLPLIAEIIAADDLRNTSATTLLEIANYLKVDVLDVTK